MLTRHTAIPDPFSQPASCLSQPCVAQIERAIIGDYVPKRMRAKWSSLESVLGFGWSGSAVMGGFLLDHYGFEFTFTFTAIMQIVGTLVRHLCCARALSSFMNQACAG